MAKAKRNRTASQLITPAGAEFSRTGTYLRVRTGGIEQSAVDLSRPEVIEFEYLQHMDVLLDAVVPLWQFAHPRVFHAGAGACALPLAWERKHPHISQVAVEVDAELAAQVVTEAGLRKLPRLRMRVGDARDVLAGSSAQYSLIVRDAFKGPQTPWHLRTTEWMNLVTSRLQTEGAYFANVGRDPGSKTKEEVATIVAAYPNTVVITDPKVWRGDRSGNLVVASFQGVAPRWKEVERELRRLPLPARLYHGAEVSRWLGGASPLRGS